MESKSSRRELLTRGLPAAAFTGAALAGSSLWAQAPGAQGAPGPEPPFASIGEKLIAQAFQNGKYALPPLPYAYDALQPAIDAQTMQLHHDVHHQGYVNGLNQAIDDLAKLRGQNEIDTVRLEAVQRNLTFNGGGHLLHTVFWASMAPQAGGEPGGEIAAAIQRAFGSFASFKRYFSQVATSVKGSGWAMMVYEPLGDTLMVFAVNDHDLRLIAGAQPLLPLDVWEHAYYLKYQNKRAEYVDAWWNVVNWPAVNDGYRWIRSRYQPQEKAQAVTG